MESFDKKSPVILEPTEGEITHTIHVWYIYLHLVDSMVNVAKHTIHPWYGL